MKTRKITRFAAFAVMAAGLALGSGGGAVAAEKPFEGVNLRPADHTREFIDTHSTGKINLDKQSCLPCHGRDFPCMGCH